MFYVRAKSTPFAGSDADPKINSKGILGVAEVMGPLPEEDLDVIKSVS